MENGRVDKWGNEEMVGEMRRWGRGGGVKRWEGLRRLWRGGSERVGVGRRGMVGGLGK